MHNLLFLYIQNKWDKEPYAQIRTQVYQIKLNDNKCPQIRIINNKIL
jgi:hypothetical protein